MLAPVSFFLACLCVCYSAPSPRPCRRQCAVKKENREFNGGMGACCDMGGVAGVILLVDTAGVFLFSESAMARPPTRRALDATACYMPSDLHDDAGLWASGVPLRALEVVLPVPRPGEPPLGLQLTGSGAAGEAEEEPLLISSVAPGSAAEKQLRPGDLLAAVNGTPVVAPSRHSGAIGIEHLLDSRGDTPPCLLYTSPSPRDRG